jgi:hypothetical protein
MAPMKYISLGWREQDGAWTAVRATEAGLAAIGAAPATTEVKEAEQDDTQAAAGIVPADTAQEPGCAPLTPPAAPEAPIMPTGAEAAQAPLTVAPARPGLRDAAHRVLAACDDDTGERAGLTDAIAALRAILVKPAPAPRTAGIRKPRRAEPHQQPGANEEEDRDLGGHGHGPERADRLRSNAGGLPSQGGEGVVEGVAALHQTGHQ